MVKMAPLLNYFRSKSLATKFWEHHARVFFADWGNKTSNEWLRWGFIYRLTSYK
jgi:hypothetical protein